MAPPFPKPEIKSPAGHWPQLRAAIEAGADAVYFGLTHFTARAKSGFTLAELPEAMRTLRSRGVKGYVTFNTLIFDEELQAAARGLAAIAEAGADAVIVQDWAAVRMVREVAPGLAIHGSTQMSITDAAGARHAQDLGVHRLILARELSLDEIRAIRAQTNVELEIFVHGALCVSYSGQCFSSEAWGGRSANRGQCAQACRLPYELMVDGRVEPLGDARYLLSPGDLYALHQIPEICRIGLSALKIEGRYKDAEYVALATRAYREAVDRACSGEPAEVPRETDLLLEQVYSRGLGPWFLTGTNHQTVVRGRAPRHRGLRMGRVTRVTERGVEVEGAPLKPGDGVVFDAADWRSPQEPEEGGRIFTVTPSAHGRVTLEFANGAVDFRRIRLGDLVWRTSDPDTARQARPFLEASAPVHRQTVHVRVEAREGAPLLTRWSVGGHAAEVMSPEPLQPTRNSPLTPGLLRAQLGRLGGTPYELGELEVVIEGAPFVPASVLNQIRRDAVEQLTALQSRAPRVEIHEAAIQIREPFEAPAAARQVHLLVRNTEQLEAALAARPASITLDYLDFYGLKPSLDRVKRAGIEARVASPRVIKPGEERIAGFLTSCDCPILVRPAGLIEALRGTLDGDFSLNAANVLSAGMLFDLGLRRLTPTHDLNGRQVAELARKIGAGRIEAVAYQHLPVFHTEHCVFCRFLSSGTSYKDCGRPCDKHTVALRDTSGRAHAVIADAGCRNTVFGAEAQEASLHLEAWLDAGIRHFRLEFVHEDAEAVTCVTAAFAEFFAGRSSSARLRGALRQSAREGITEGSLCVPTTLLPVLQ